MADKIQQAENHIKNAEKALKSTFFRWKPDYDSAADAFTQAAQCYRIVRDQKKVKEFYAKAAECHIRNNALFHAGKCLETAMMACKETCAADEIFTMASDASTYYQQYGSGDAGAGVLEKAAKILEENDPEKAVKLYQMAADVSSTESSQHQGAEYMRKSSRILTRLELFDQAVDSLRREIGYNLEHGNYGAVGRLVVAIVIVQLARGDPVAAEKAYKEWGNNCEAAESTTLEQLLQAYDEEDRAGARAALSSPFIRSMDVEYSRLAMTVPLPEGIEPAPSAGVRENAAPSYVSANVAASAGPAPSCSGAAKYSEDGEEESPYEAVTYDNKKADDEDGLC
ncbi:gamma-soluble NSF attachment protein [Ostrinia nubilalis]|uniref:gamma-soluble NSF attachment protein n=1 Tax=Ostrinia furnacalis TaxID=93504 RepID=UPI00103D88DA|nr:gamma-soluble NSF attachment protein [Ostrinia furnacalis]